MNTLFKEHALSELFDVFKMLFYVMKNGKGKNVSMSNGYGAEEGKWFCFHISIEDIDRLRKLHDLGKVIPEYSVEVEYMLLLSNKNLFSWSADMSIDGNITDYPLSLYNIFDELRTILEKK